MRGPPDSGCSVMKWRIALGVLTAAVPLQLASAQVFPRHEDICVGGIVAKEKLAKAFLKVEQGWLNLYVDAVEPANLPNPQPQWRRIFTDRNFCKNNPGCLSADTEAKPSVRN